MFSLVIEAYLLLCRLLNGTGCAGSCGGGGVGRFEPKVFKTVTLVKKDIPPPPPMNKDAPKHIIRLIPKLPQDTNKTLQTNTQPTKSKKLSFENNFEYSNFFNS